MNGFIPPGYRAVFLGSAASIKELGSFAPLEEGAAEGALMLMQLDFTEVVPGETLEKLNKALADAGVPPWLGYGCIVYADTTKPTVYLAWQKGIAWMPVIIGILLFTLLPPLLGAIVWWLLPEEIKQLITGLIGMGMMMLVMWLMMSLMKPLLAPEKEKPKKLKKSPEKAEEVTAA